MGINYIEKLSSPAEIKNKYPVTAEMKNLKEKRDLEIKAILSGESEKFLLIIGPCSADCEKSVLDYTKRLAKIQKEVADKILFQESIQINLGQLVLVIKECFISQMF